MTNVSETTAPDVRYVAAVLPPLKSLAPNTHKLLGAVVVRLAVGAAEDALLVAVATPAPLLLLNW
jgi:hypothetical protein